MEILLLLVEKLIIMFLFMMIGVVLFKRKIITEVGSESLANLLIYLILPCVILNGFLVNQSPERVYGLLLCTGLSVAALFLSILIARLFFKKNPVGNFAAAFSNPGFFGIPLIVSVLGSGHVFYVAPFVACLNILQWTYGVSILKEENIKIDIKKILKSPFIISFLLGIILFLSSIPLPEAAKSVISTSAGLNTPVAMIVSGIYLAKADLKAMFTRWEFYKISLVRLLLIPALSCLLFCLIPNSILDIKIPDIKMCLFLAVACPVGSNVAVYAQLHGKNYIYAVQTVVLSTILSMVTIPLWVLFAQWLWY